MTTPALSDEQIDALIETALPKLDMLARRALTFTRWHDGIDCDYVTVEARAFARALLAAQQDSSHLTEPACQTVPGDAPIKLGVIRKWPDGFAARWNHVTNDLRGFIIDYWLYDLSRTLAEIGYRMEVYAPARLTPDEPKASIGAPDTDTAGVGPSDDRLRWALRQIAQLDPKANSVGTAITFAQAALDASGVTEVPRG